MADNQFLTPTFIARQILRLLENNCVMGGLVYREYQDSFHKVGDNITIRGPSRYRTVDGPDVTGQLQQIQEPSLELQLNYWKSVPMEISVKDWTLSVEDFSKRHLVPAAASIADVVDRACMSCYKQIYNAVGTAGTTPNTFKAFGEAAKLMTKLAVPSDNRHLVIDPDANLEITDAIKGLFSTSIVEPAVKRGFVGLLAGLEINETQNVMNHTKGTATGTPLTNGAGQTGASLITDGWTASQATILKEGDIFTLAGIYSVNPMSGASTGELQQFVATADVASDSGGNATIPISPAIVTSGAYQTVTAAPGDGVALAVVADHAANLAFHSDAIALATVPIELPQSVPWKGRASHNGLTLTVTKDFQILPYSEIIRVDILFGTKAIYPALGCRLLG